MNNELYNYFLFVESIVKKPLFIYFSLLSLLTAQNQNWINYTTTETIFDIISVGDNLWLGGNGGLVKFNKTTEEFTYYTKGNANLPGNNIRAVDIDSLGYIWIGTQQNGIGRFDGYNCRVFNQGNSLLPNDQLNTSIKVDLYGNIWIGSAGSLIKVDKNKIEDYNWIIYRNENILSPYPAIFDIEFADNDAVWIGAHWGLSRLQNDSIQTNYDDFREVTQAVKIDFNNDLWIGTQYSGIYKYNGLNWMNYNTTNSELPSNGIYNLTLDNNGTLWAATGGGLAKFDGIKWSTYNIENSGLPSNVLLSLEADIDGFLWIGYLENYMSKFDLNTTKLVKTYELSNSSIGNNRVESIAEDSYSNMWISSYSLLSKFDGKEWFTYETTNFDLLDLSFTRIYEDSLMVLWKGSNLLILFRDKKEWVVSEIKNKHTGGKLKEDYNKNIWLASSCGIQKFNGTRWIVYNTDNSTLPANNIAKFCFDKSNNMLVSTIPDWGEKGMLIKYDGKNWSVLYTCAADHYWIAGLEIDFSDHLWTGILNRSGVSVEQGGGLKKFDGKEWTSYDIYNSELPSNSVVQLCLDSKNNIWIGTYDGGTAKFDCKNNWIIYNKNNSGLPSNNIERIVIDSKNNKWFGVQQDGLTVFNEEGINLTDIEEESSDQFANNYILSQNYPNPFNPVTTISYSLPEQTHVSIKIFDVLGRKIIELVNETKLPGKHKVIFDGSKLSSGFYYYSIETDNYRKTKKLVLLK